MEPVDVLIPVQFRTINLFGGVHQLAYVGSAPIIWFDDFLQKILNGEPL